MLRAIDLTMSYGGGAAAVKDVSLTVERGQIAAIIGPNGAGKTTFLNMMSGVLTPTVGRVEKDGRDITSVAAHRRCRLGMGRTFQQPSFFPGLTVVENVQVPLNATGGRWRRMVGRSRTSRRREAMAVLELVGMSDVADVTARQLPYGDQRRLEVAIALGTDPDLLLLDEPMAGMSARERRTVVELLLALNADRGLTIAFTEHDMDIVFSLSHVVHVLYQGQLFASGTPQEIQEHSAVQRIYLGTGEQ